MTTTEDSRLVGGWDDDGEDAPSLDPDARRIFGSANRFLPRYVWSMILAPRWPERESGAPGFFTPAALRERRGRF